MYFFDNDSLFGSRTACIDEEGRSYTYSQLREMGDGKIERIERGKLVLLLCSNGIESLSIYLALLRKRCPVILMGKDTDEKLLQGMVESYSPDFVIDPQRGRIEAIEGGSEGWDIYPETALLLSTSGSTGDRKLVRLSYDNLQSNCEAISRYLELSCEERAITTLPMEYTYGLSVIHSHLNVGATIVLTERNFFEKEFWEKVSRYEITSMAGVPYSYEMLFKRLKIDRMDLPHLKTMTQAGGHLKVELQEHIGRWAENTGRKFYVMYGQTEATARMSYLPPDMCLEKIGSIGIPIPGGRMEVEDGELVYYGDNVSLGYATCREDLEKGDENRGRLLTGDMGYSDSQGYFYITGRKKRFIKLFGKRMSLDQIEEAAREILQIDDIACTGTDDKEITLWTSHHFQKEDEEKVRELFGERFAIKGRLIKMEYIETIPRNSSGKVLYGQLKGKENIR